MTAAWNVNNLYSPGLLGFRVRFKKIATKPSNRISTIQMCDEQADARCALTSIQLELRSTSAAAPTAVFFLFMCVSVIFRLNCNSQNRIPYVCWWCAAIGVDVESAEKMDFIPFQYETISLYRICLTVPSVRSQKHYRNFVCTHTRRKTPLPDTHSAVCEMWVHIYTMRMEKIENTEAVVIDFVAFQHCSKCKTAVCLAFGRQIQFVWYIFSLLPLSHSQSQSQSVSLLYGAYGP